MSERVLIVDDDPSIVELLERTLERAGYAVEGATDGDQALRLLEQSVFDAVLLDVQMPGRTGVELLDAFREAGHRVPVVMLSGQSDIETAVIAVRKGARDFIEKPVRRERLVASLRSAVKAASFDFGTLPSEDADYLGDLLGNTPAMRNLKRLISLASPSEGRVLITGENGTGKELVARAIHAGSLRAKHPFIKVNCAAVPLELIESELFGHERGSFTGAVTSRQGKFEAASGGTLLLDEVGDMPLLMQAKVLRVLQEGEIEPVGASQTRAVDVRVVAATNRDLPKMVASGAFRQDLYYRLNVVPIRVPPLRERRDDIEALARTFLLRCAERNNRRVPRLTPDALEKLKQHSFPGNVRELENMMERLLILDDGGVIEGGDVALINGSNASSTAASTLYRPGSSLKAMLAEAETRIIEQALADHDGNMTETAESLGLERSHLYKKVRALGVRRP